MDARAQKQMKTALKLTTAPATYLFACLCVGYIELAQLPEHRNLAMVLMIAGFFAIGLTAAALSLIGNIVNLNMSPNRRWLTKGVAAIINLPLSISALIAGGATFALAPESPLSALAVIFFITSALSSIYTMGWIANRSEQGQ